MLHRHSTHSTHTHTQITNHFLIFPFVPGKMIWWAGCFKNLEWLSSCCFKLLLLLLSGSTENELLRQEESRQHCASRPSGPNPFGRYIIPAGPPSQRRRSLWKIGGAPVAYPVASLFLWKCLTPRHQRHKREKWKVGGVDWAGNDAQSQLCHWSITFESNYFRWQS